MKRLPTTAKFMASLLVGTLLASCSIDDSYDLGEDIDMTVGLGSDGLALRLGQTENIYLRDILDVDRNEGGLIDTTASGTFYLIKGGQAQTSFSIEGIAAQSVDPVNLRQDIEVGLSGDVVPNLEVKTALQMTDRLNITIDDIRDDVTKFYSIVPENTAITLDIQLMQPTGSHFAIKEIRDFVIEFPSFIHSSQFEAGTHRLNLGTLTDIEGQARIAGLTIDSITTDGNSIVDQALTLSDDIGASGELTLTTGNTTYVAEGSEYALGLTVTVGAIRIASISGVFNPVINPDINPLEISNNLPNFLRDESVRLYMSNPTVRIATEGTGVPVPLLLSGTLTSWKNHSRIADPVLIPSAGKGYLYPLRDNLLYFYEGDAPFEPQGIAPEAQTLKADGLASLMVEIPDEVQIDMNNGHIVADPEARHTLMPGRSYYVDIDYDILIPFSYNAGTRIVYSDSTDNINKDIKDFEADGAEISATAVNTIPLNLNIDVVPYDLQGNDLSDVITVTPAVARAAENGTPQSTALTISMTAKDRSAVSRIEKLVFRLQGEATGAETLGSDQYIRLDDIRIRLKGQITADFN